ncbi:MAG: hypothetical protein GX594_04860 [Pirellulaceae bacterium]|nr:hypothetical protein [Pirellulaceae bacterium]
MSLIGETGCFQATDDDAASTVKRCIDLELQAKRLYETLGQSVAEAAEFFAELASQEQKHADLLRVSMAAARHRGWRRGGFNLWRDDLPRLEQQMRDAEISASAVDSLDDALRLVVSVESSEINAVFQRALAACNSSFTRRLDPFRTAVEKHLDYIVTQIVHLAPNLRIASGELRARFPQSA